MRFSNKNMTPLQRRTLQRMSGVLMLTLLANLTTPKLPNPLFDLFPSLIPWLDGHGHPSLSMVLSLAVLSVLPVLLAMWIVARYLKAEPDEFIRAILIRSLLWGFAITMAANAATVALMNLYAHPFPLSVLDADVLFASTGIAFRLIQRSYR